jgi:hypothetical protein
MADLQIKEYDPLSSSRTTRISEEVWSTYRETIHDMHIAKCTRNEMLDKLAHDHDFHPTFVNLTIPAHFLLTRSQTWSTELSHGELELQGIQASRATIWSINNYIYWILNGKLESILVFFCLF